MASRLVFSGMVDESFFQVLSCFETLLFDLPFGLYFRGNDFLIIVID
jgi:hypothetical protein